MSGPATPMASVSAPTPPPPAPAPLPPAALSAARLRTRLAIVVGLLIAANLGLIGWMLSPYAPSTAATREQLAGAQTQLASMQKLNGQLGDLSGQVRIGQAQADKLLAAGMPPESVAYSRLLAELQRIANATGTQVSAATFAPDKNVIAGLRQVRIEIGLDGTYNGIVRFINETEQSPVFFLIDQINASSERTEQATVAPVRLQMQMEAFMQAGGGTTRGGVR